MSQTGKSMQALGYDSLTSRFRDLLGSDENKPDFKELDLDSPVSPLKTPASVNTAGAGASNTSSCSSTSSAGSVSGSRNTVAKLPSKPDAKPRNNSGELCETNSNASESLQSASASRRTKPGHRRSVSAGAPLIYSGTNFLPTGNICSTGRISKTGLAPRTPNRTDVLGSGTVNYGRGNIMRGGGKMGNGGHAIVDDNVAGNSQLGGVSGIVKKAMSGSDPEEVKNAGNELYRSGNFAEALSLYDRAISISPNNPAYRSNRAAALTAVGKLAAAAKECEEAVKLNPGYARAHQRLASLYLRFGQVENAQSHLCIPGKQVDQSELYKLKLLEKYLKRCAEARRIGDWKNTLRESDAAIAVGADFSPQLVACKAEAYLKLHLLEDAESTLSNIPKLEGCSQTKFFGMIGEAYVPFVRSQVEMALGRFENAVAEAEKASLIDYSNVEVARVVNTVKIVARARSRGNDLFGHGKFSEACSAYGEGLKYDSSNYVLFCNRAVCWSKLGLWEKSVEDCNHALLILPNCTKALLRRAVSNSKLERWGDAIRDYEALKRELPGDSVVAESLHQAQLALRKSRGEDCVSKLVLEVEEVSTLDRLKAAIASSGISAVHFKKASHEQCQEISPFINTLCIRYPYVKFIKVDVEECTSIAKAESIRAVPTFRIYTNGEKVMEMIRPSHQLLEDSVRNCCNL
ncbi:hypothetical protein K1719_031215 [Acacia pycnantha]|nr:hypothetical protein K1719_031215 [Acacia pycnantha]